MARGKHLFPFRTEQLSPSAPMVLGPQGPGRVGRRRFDQCNEPPSGGSFALSGRLEWLESRPSGAWFRRWLGEGEQVSVRVPEPCDASAAGRGPDAGVVLLDPREV